MEAGRGGGEGAGEEADSVTVGNEMDRCISMYELEWDDMFRDDDPAMMSSSTSASGVTEPPRHIQEMRRSAIVLEV